MGDRGKHTCTRNQSIIGLEQATGIDSSIQGFLPRDVDLNVPGSEMNNSTESGHGSSGYNSPNDSILSITQGNDSALPYTQGNDSALSHTQGNDSALSHTQNNDSVLSHTQSIDSALPPYSGNEDDSNKTLPRSKSEGSPCQERVQENVHQVTDDSEESSWTLNCESLGDDFMSDVSSILNGSASSRELPSVAAVTFHSHGQVEQDSVEHTEYDANEASLQTTADSQTGQDTLGENDLHVLPMNDPPSESAAAAITVWRRDQLERVRQQNNLAGDAAEEPGFPASARSVDADTTQLNEHGRLTRRESDPGNEDTRDLDGGHENLEVVDGALGGTDPKNPPISVSTDVDINVAWKRKYAQYGITIKINDDDSTLPTINVTGSGENRGQPCMLSSSLQQSPQNMHNNLSHQMLSGHSSVESSQRSPGGLTSFGEAPTNQERCATCFQRPKQTRNYPCECVCNCRDCSNVMIYCSMCQRKITDYDVI